MRCRDGWMDTLQRVVPRLQEKGRKLRRKAEKGGVQCKTKLDGKVEVLSRQTRAMSSGGTIHVSGWGGCPYYRRALQAAENFAAGSGGAWTARAHAFSGRQTYLDLFVNKLTWKADESGVCKQAVISMVSGLLCGNKIGVVFYLSWRDGWGILSDTWLGERM